MVTEDNGLTTLRRHGGGTSTGSATIGGTVPEHLASAIVRTARQAAPRLVDRLAQRDDPPAKAAASGSGAGPVTGDAGSDACDAGAGVEERWRALGAEAERRRIAGELHDRVAPTLAVLGLELDRLRRHGADDELRPGIDRVRDDVRAAMREVREILGELRRTVPPQPGGERASGPGATG